MASAIISSATMLISLLGWSLMAVSAGNFKEEFNITYGHSRIKPHGRGKIFTLTLDKESGSGFVSKNAYLNGKFDMLIKLDNGGSAGIVTTFYISSLGSAHDEVDFEFLGNRSGDPYTLSTNVYTQGKGDREMKFNLWFDPTKQFHNYSIIWNPLNVILYVDGIPIREFKNLEQMGVPYPTKQPMYVFGSLWQADWATSEHIKTNWNEAPYTATYGNFNAQACVWSSGSPSCSTTTNAWLTRSLNSKERSIMKVMQKKYMSYDYCNDRRRFAAGLPPECPTPYQPR